MFPAIPPNEILDQYGCKPMGSTTVAHADITNLSVVTIRMC